MDEVYIMDFGSMEASKHTVEYLIDKEALVIARKSNSRSEKARN